MKQSGIDVRLNTPFKEVKNDSENLKSVYLESGEVLKANKVL